MPNGRIYIFVDPFTPDTPWVIRYEDKQSITGFNETRAKDVQIRTPCKTVTIDQKGIKGRYQLETHGSIHKHPLEDRIIIQSNSLPTPW